MISATVQAKLQYRDYTFLGTTQSLCPDCLGLVPAKIVERNGRVYFRKQCATHGPREDFVCSDARWFDRTDYSLPGKLPRQFGTAADRGCPYDCGLCSEHEQHTCIGLIEINSACNLQCPICFAASGPQGTHLSVPDCCRAIDRLVEVEGQPEIVQLSGGEPTIHPQFLEICRYACEQPIDIVMINTNGIRLAHDRELVQQLAELRHRLEIYLQMDGFSDDGCRTLRGESLVQTKLRAIEVLGEAGLRTTLVCTVQTDVNEHELGRLVQFGTQRPWITGVSFQPATYCGRFVLPDQLERRVTFPDIVQGISQQTDGEWLESDFSPLPCAHPNAHSLAYAYRHGDQLLPLARFVDLENHLDLLSGRITFNRERARQLIGQYLSRLSCGSAGCSDDGQDAAMPASRQRAVKGASRPALDPQQENAAEEFFERALTEDLAPEDVFRITTTSFMDAYNFDVRQLMKSCVHHILPSGHVIPFSAYNVLYRDGHVSLPILSPTSTPTPIFTPTSIPTSTA
ncbi:MAG: radical SAM protein [Planctomycetota bacterium]|nr:radical SAM protein [Planctomycetota bacterium]